MIFDISHPADEINRQRKATAAIDPTRAKVDRLFNQLFFDSATRYIKQVDYRQDPQQVIIDFRRSPVCDDAATKAIAKYPQLDKRVVLMGLNSKS